MLFRYYGPTSSCAPCAASALPSIYDLPKSCPIMVPTAQREKERATHHREGRQPPPTVSCMKGPSHNCSFIHGSFTNCVPSPVLVLDVQEWARGHSPSSSHTAQTGHRQVNKHCECNVPGQRYGRMPLSSLPTKLVSQLHTWVSGCGSNPGSRRQMLTRSSDSIHPTSTVLTQSQLFSRKPQQSDHSLTLFVLSSLILQL